MANPINTRKTIQKPSLGASMAFQASLALAGVLPAEETAPQTADQAAADLFQAALGSGEDYGMVYTETGHASGPAGQMTDLPFSLARPGGEAEWSQAEWSDAAQAEWSISAQPEWSDVAQAEWSNAAQAEWSTGAEAEWSNTGQAQQATMDLINHEAFCSAPPVEQATAINIMEQAMQQAAEAQAKFAQAQAVLQAGAQAREGGQPEAGQQQSALAQAIAMLQQQTARVSRIA